MEAKLTSSDSQNSIEDENQGSSYRSRNWEVKFNNKLLIFKLNFTKLYFQKMIYFCLYTQAPAPGLSDPSTASSISSVLSISCQVNPSASSVGVIKARLA
ncbi:unnamed protein product [Blepharisma stoltei]|uniref:Uncharacterized protein n=1 Tax=Blepharisma stoltei TaxID=1481888 RepID=A0AAU9IFM4_9CILI|nr:unnamed protein product [Blepharisma stoltei]